MKIPLKIFLALVCAFAIVLCLLGAVISAASFSFSIEHIVRTASGSLGFVDILSIISDSTGIAIALGFAFFFLIVAFIGCLGIIAIFLSVSAKKVDTLVNVVNSAENNENNSKIQSNVESSQLA